MKIKFFYGLILILTSLSLGAEPAESSLPRPKLVVGIVVDQMRWDYLYRYYDRYGDRGFKRLLKEGFTCENTQLNYLPAFTAVGHTCIYTGSVPSVTGIAANDFYIEKEKKKLYCTADPTVECVGSDSQAGRMSPRNLWVTTITDELRLGTNFHSKVIGIALKDRAAILPAGHTANAAYWFDYDSGKWITSSYYTDKLPRWVEDFNARDRASQLLQQDWNTLYPIGTYKQSTKDDTPYEAPFIKGEKPVFPIPTSKLLKTNGYSMIRQTPYGNTFTLEMAKTAVEKEEMGQREETDFLAVSLSATDYIGHQFGTNAIETEDTYLRLDQDLGLFFEFLDEKIGRDHYTVFLTADQWKNKVINPSIYLSGSTSLSLLSGTASARIGQSMVYGTASASGQVGVVYAKAKAVLSASEQTLDLDVGAAALQGEVKSSFQFFDAKITLTGSGSIGSAQANVSYHHKTREWEFGSKLGFICGLGFKVKVEY